MQSAIRAAIRHIASFKLDLAENRIKAKKGGVKDAKCWANVKEVQFSNLAMSMRR